MFIIILALTAVVFKSSDAWVYYENEIQAPKKKGAKQLKGGAGT
jgi:multiple sugar transport system permease protein